MLGNACFPLAKGDSQFDFFFKNSRAWLFWSLHDLGLIPYFQRQTLFAHAGLADPNLQRGLQPRVRFSCVRFGWLAFHVRLCFGFSTCTLDEMRAELGQLPIVPA